MQRFIKEVARGKRGSTDLAYEDALEAAEEMVQGRATDAQIAAFLIGERLKTESPEELLAFVQKYSSSTNKLQLSSTIQNQIIDFASPYTGRNSFIATIPVSILLAERGIPVFLHASKSLPPKNATSIGDILLNLGIKTDLTGETLSSHIKDVKIGFANTESFCEPLKRIRSIREEIYVRTIFNTAEKLLNIANAKSVMLGAFHRTAINKLHPIFSALSYENVYIAQGVEGSEDLPVHRNSFIYKIVSGEIDSFIVNPSEYGLEVDEKFYMKELSLKDQCTFVKEILGDKQSSDLQYIRNQVIFNTAIRYYLFGYEHSIEAGIEFVTNQLAAKSGLGKLGEWVIKSNS